MNETFDKVQTGLAAGAKDAASKVLSPPPPSPREVAREYAEWWVKQTDSRTQRLLLRAALTVDSGISLANDIHAVFDKNNTPAQRIVALTELFNKSGHRISEEVTRAAIKGVATAGTTAIDEVSKTILQFPSSRAGVLSRARLEHQLVVARERAVGADQANQANQEILRAGFFREIDEQIKAAEAERRALAEEQARIAREHQERIAAWHRQQAYAHAMEQQRRFNEYQNWVQAQNAYISNFIAAAQSARRTGPSYGAAPIYRPPPRPVGGGGGTHCPAGMVCIVR